MKSTANKTSIWLLALIALCGGNYLLFDAVWRINYFDWFRHAGPAIGLATSVFAAAWGGMDKNTGLISANPREYGGACLQVAGLPILAFGGHLRHQGGRAPLDRLCAMPLIIAFTLCGMAWLLFIAPLQYFVFLICAAPSRLALRSCYRLDAAIADGQVFYTERQVSDAPVVGFWDASLRERPVVLSAAFSAALFMLLDWIV